MVKRKYCDNCKYINLEFNNCRYKIKKELQHTPYKSKCVDIHPEPSKDNKFNNCKYYKEYTTEELRMQRIQVGVGLFIVFGLVIIIVLNT